MKSYRDIILFILVILGSAAAGIWVLEHNKPAPKPLEDEQVATAEAVPADERIPNFREGASDEEKRQEVNQSVEKQFEDMLNDFLRDLASKSNAYKDSRQALGDLIKPENIREEAFVAENKTFAENLITEMESQMDGIISSFDKADQEIKVLISTNPGVDEQIILSKWKSIKDERMENYMSFFLLEKDYLKKHIDILDLLIRSTGQFKIDVINNNIVFSNERAETLYRQYLADMDNITQQEELIFAVDSTEQTPTPEAQAMQPYTGQQPAAGTAMPAPVNDPAPINDNGASENN